MGDEEEAERKHPESEKRENREDPAQDEEHTDRYSDPVSARMTQPSHGSSHPLGHLLLEVLEGPPQDELTLALRAHIVGSIWSSKWFPWPVQARPP
jgi:hypothetical protein